MICGQLDQKIISFQPGRLYKIYKKTYTGHNDAHRLMHPIFKKDVENFVLFVLCFRKLAEVMNRFCSHTYLIKLTKGTSSFALAIAT